MSLQKLQLICTVTVVAAAVGLSIIEKQFPFEKGQKLFRKGFFDDLVMYTFLQSYVLGVVVSFLIQALDKSTRFSGLQIISAWPVWQQILLFFIGHDFFMYWFHRLQHTSAVLWRTHEVHHTSTVVDWLAGSRAMPMEIVITEFAKYAPMILLGASPETALLKGVIDSLWGMFEHANVNVKIGLLKYIFNGPEMHRWHHASDADAHNKNFGTKLALWDWLFGTAYCPRDKRPSGYGLGVTDIPENYFGQLLSAFRWPIRTPEVLPKNNEPFDQLQKRLSIIQTNLT